MGILAMGDVVDSIGSGLDAVCVFVGDLDRELLFDGHDNLDGVERVQVEIVVEAGLEGDLCSWRNTRSKKKRYACSEREECFEMAFCQIVFDRARGMTTGRFVYHHCKC